MNRLLYTAMLLLVALASPAKAQEQDSLIHADEIEVALVNGRYVTYVVGNVAFQVKSALIYCDSAIWIKSKRVNLKGNVLVDDKEYKLRCDSAVYDIVTEEYLARGSFVELWSYDDSLYAVGTHAYLDRQHQSFEMEERPVVYLNYPDSGKMVEIIADIVCYDALTKKAEALFDVIITSTNLSSHSGCALLDIATNDLDLFDEPTATSGKSQISGDLISVKFVDKLLERIDVQDSARGEFNEPVDSAGSDYDRSVLTGNRIIFDFRQGVLRDVTCYGQAYSWYYPSTRDGLEEYENTVSGDTIKFHIFSDRLTTVSVVGGAIGTYISHRYSLMSSSKDTLAAALPPPSDTMVVADTTQIIPGRVLTQADTIDYGAQYLEYDLLDSMITLDRAASVQSGTVSLDAQKVSLDTDKRLIEAFSATTSDDSTQSGENEQSAKLQPNTIPVILRDNDEEIYGDYLEYSIDTEKGHIIQSKAAYEAGLYYGDRLLREQKHIFYVTDGRYTTCDADEPHFHFHSKNMKLMQDDKLIAQPVVFYIERLPLIILPYYVFPLKRGRHSGLLPFTFGKFQLGDRYVKDFGYYWAASDYIDFKTAFDYNEKNHTVTFRERINFNKRYVLDGYVTGDYARETSYDKTVADERRRTRWVGRGAYNHTITPTFQVRAYGDFQSDKTYYNDYSQNINERLNRETKSQISFSKKFGKSTSLSGQVSHTVNLDAESRSDMLPSLGLSLPTLWVFGSGQRDENGQLQQNLLQRITLRYSPNLINYSSRTTVITAIDSVLDSTGALVSFDTSSYRSRRKYAKISHNPTLNLPTLTLAKYVIFNPRVSYSETWFKIFETDQSIAAGIDASTTYRTYSYDAGVSLKTSLYGTAYPNTLGLIGLRHVFTPSVSYRYKPDIDRHPAVRAFAGGGAGSRKSSAMAFSLNQLFQAKVKSGEVEKNLDILSLTTGFNYNFEADEKPWSNMSTSFNSSVLRRINFSGSMQHTFYDPDTDEFNFFSPYLESFSFNVRTTLSGRRFLFDEAPIRRDKADTSSAPRSQLRPQTSQTKSSGWSLSTDYSYSESGRGSSFYKRSFIRLNLRFNLTPNTTVAYSQSYDFGNKLTVNNSVNIVRKLHCWTGSLYWVPIGSNRGFGFKLFVTALPEIKLDNAHDSFLDRFNQ